MVLLAVGSWPGQTHCACLLVVLSTLSIASCACASAGLLIACATKQPGHMPWQHHSLGSTHVFVSQTLTSLSAEPVTNRPVSTGYHTTHVTCTTCSTNSQVSCRIAQSNEAVCCMRRRPKEASEQHQELFNVEQKGISARDQEALGLDWAHSHTLSSCKLALWRNFGAPLHD